MKKTKKGFTLLEVIVGMLVLGFALVVGAQTFAAVGTGYTRSAMLDHGADALFNAFEQGASTFPENVTITQEAINVRITVGSNVFINGSTLTTMHYANTKDKVYASLYGLSNAYGKGK